MSKATIMFVLIFTILSSHAYAEAVVVDSAIIRTDMIETFTAINHEANEAGDWQLAFPGWSELEVTNFFENVQLYQTDYDLTTEGLQKFGADYETNPITRMWARNDLPPHQLIGPSCAVAYFLVKDMHPNDRRLALLTTAFMEYVCISGWRNDGIEPSDPRAVPPVTIFRIEF